MLKANKKQVNN